MPSRPWWRLYTGRERGLGRAEMMIAVQRIEDRIGALLDPGAQRREPGRLANLVEHRAVIVPVQVEQALLDRARDVLDRGGNVSPVTGSLDDELAAERAAPAVRRHLGDDRAQARALARPVALDERRHELRHQPRHE